MPQDKKTLIESSGKAARRIRREAIRQSPKVGALVDAQRQLQTVAAADEPFITPSMASRQLLLRCSTSCIRAVVDPGISCRDDERRSVDSH